MKNFNEDILKLKLLDPVYSCIKEYLCPMLGEKGLIKPMPIDDRLKTIYLKTWREKILEDLNIIPNEELRGPAYSYFDAINSPEISGPDCLRFLRIDLSNAAEDRYKELEKKIEIIKADLEDKSSRW
jgi:hypothetical protein